MHPRLVLPFVGFVACSSGETLRLTGSSGGPPTVSPGAPAPAPKLDAPFYWHLKPVDGRASAMGSQGTNTRAEVRLGTRDFRLDAAIEGQSLVLYRFETASRAETFRKTLDIGQLGRGMREPVVAYIPDGDRVLVGLVTEDGRAFVVPLSAATGEAAGAILPLPADLPVDGLQLRQNAEGERLHVHLRHPTGDSGGTVIVIAAGDLRIEGAAKAPRGSVLTRWEEPPPPVSEPALEMRGGEKIRVSWQGENLAVERVGSTTWRSVFEKNQFRMEMSTLHEAHGRVLLTQHHPMASVAIARAFDGATGKELWAIRPTGIGPVVHSAYQNEVRSSIDGPYLKVFGNESGGAYACTILIETGREAACVVGFEPPHAPGGTPAVAPLPSGPLGPQVSSLACIPKKSPKLAINLDAADDKQIKGRATVPSSSCKPKIGGGIAGERIQIEAFDGSDRPAGPSCSCSFTFTQERRPESKVVELSVRGRAGVERVELR